MVARWAEGWETHQNSAQLLRKYAAHTGSITAAAGRVFGSSAGCTARVLVTPSFGLADTWVHGFGVRIVSQQTGLNSGKQGFYFEKSATEQCHLEFVNNAGSFEVRLMRDTTQIAITTSAFAYAVWHYFEWKVTIATGTGGSYEVRHNGVNVLSGSGVNLANAGSNQADIFAMRFSSSLGTNYLDDDHYVLDGTGAVNNNFLSPVIVEGILPNGVGTATQWTNDAGTGSNWENVDDAGSAAPDETGAGGTNSSDTATQKDTYAFQDLTQILGAIHFVQLGTQLAMAAAGSRSVKTKFRDNGGSEVDIATKVVALTAYDEFVDVMDVNPQSAAAWDVTDIQGGEFGVEIA
jgi:hypothetical protein